MICQHSTMIQGRVPVFPQALIRYFQRQRTDLFKGRLALLIKQSNAADVHPGSAT